MQVDETLFYSDEFERSLDSQRRIAIPRIWRRSEGETRFYLVPSRNNVLQLIPYESFKSFLDKARQIPFTDANFSMALAKLGSRAQDCRCDRQGRIQINTRLLDYAQLKEQVVLVGAISTIQIWNPERWRDEQERIQDETFLDDVQKISEISLS